MPSPRGPAAAGFRSRSDRRGEPNPSTVTRPPAADDPEAAAAHTARLAALVRAVDAAVNLLAASLVVLLAWTVVAHTRHNTETASSYFTQKGDTRHKAETASAYFTPQGAGAVGGDGHNGGSRLPSALVAVVASSSLTAATAFAVRWGFPRGPVDVPLSKAGLLLTLAPAACFGLQWAGLLLPSYPTQVLVTGALELAQLLLQVACGGPHGNLTAPLLVAAVWGATDVLPLLACAPAGAWTGRLALAPHSLPLATTSAFVRQWWWVYSDRRMWGAGFANGTLPWLAHGWGGLAHHALVVGAKVATLQAFKRRVADPRLRVVATVLQVVLVAVPLYVALAVARPADDPPSSAAMAADVLTWSLQYHIVPLVLVALLDSAHEHEQRALTQLAEAERSAAQAEDSAARRRTVLRYVCHEARVPLQTITLGIEDLQATLGAAGPNGDDDVEGDDEGAAGSGGDGVGDSGAGSDSEGDDRSVHAPPLSLPLPPPHHQRALTDATALRHRRRRVGSDGSSSGGTRDAGAGAHTAGGTGNAPLGRTRGGGDGGSGSSSGDDRDEYGGVGGSRGEPRRPPPWLSRAARRHAADTLAVLLNAAEAARHVVDSTLTLERIDAGEYTMNMRPGALRSSVVAVHELMAPLASASGVRLVTRTDARERVERMGVPRGSLALLDEVKMQQVRE